jgi:hypothetical protein
VLISMRVQGRLVEQLERKLGIDGREDVRLRLLGEFALSAWRCGAKNWIAGRGEARKRNPRTRATLIQRVRQAFNAIPASLSLKAP